MKRKRFGMVSIVFFAVVLAGVVGQGAPPVAGVARTYIPGDRACPWYDRLGRWVMVNVPAALRGKAPVPRQSCAARSVVLPGPGLESVVIGLSRKDLPLFRATVHAGVRETGLDFGIQAPSGGEILSYTAVVVSHPPPVLKVPSAGAGLILLALTDITGGATALPEPAVASPLPEDSAFAAQPWPFHPGPRTVNMYVAAPAAGITAHTGIMLCLHNWGGRYNQTTYKGWCRAFAERYNVIAISVNYLQSGGGEPTIPGVKPYDHGYLQAMDCLRAIYHVRQRLKAAGIAFHPHRCYAMGGSGGGNVSLMVNKFAPHTFACVVDICGMPGLTDGIAYGTGEYGSHLNAGYSKDPASPAYLSPDMQEIRNPGLPAHLAIQYKANPNNKVVIVHGLDDRSCPVVHAITMFRNMVAAGFHPDGHFLTERDVDGTIITTTGHRVGNREKVTEKFADDYLLESGRLAATVAGPDDFERKSLVVYPTRGGRTIIDFSGPPTIRFEKSNP